MVYLRILIFLKTVYIEISLYGDVTPCSIVSRLLFLITGWHEVASQKPVILVFYSSRFQVLTAVQLRTRVSGDVTLGFWVRVYRRFEGSYRLHILIVEQFRRVIIKLYRCYVNICSRIYLRSSTSYGLYLCYNVSGARTFSAVIFHCFLSVHMVPNLGPLWFCVCCH